METTLSDLRPKLAGARLATLGPAGTDAEAEARQLGADVTLCGSFPLAMGWAHENQGHALVAAGYLDVHERTFPAWVDLHFSFREQLSLRAVWESPTKEMCVAVRTGQCADLDEVRSVALHASTRSLVADLFESGVELDYVRAKPLAVGKLVDGVVDACVGSVDVVGRHSELTILESFTPSMVWCLYGPATPAASEAAGACPELSAVALARVAVPTPAIPRDAN